MEKRSETGLIRLELGDVSFKIYTGYKQAALQWKISDELL